ncbi:MULTISPECIES: DNRLRE domain-containing protein [Sorangium]|uniref:DNRLRE domain-containing protein n=1 Tax=Sorangium TaxID=39643 RepID=UPI001A93042A|nr:MULTISPECIES: DNRLRE domain-containing protein [Sorangium]
MLARRHRRASLQALEIFEPRNRYRRRYPLLANGVLLSAIAFGAGCGSGSPNEELHGTAKLALEDPTCVTIQRGTAGAVEDATIWETFPTWSDSTVLLRTGTLAEFGVRHAVLRFDLSPVPAGANVVSATLRLEQIFRDTTSSSTINIHRILSPWTESTVTWQSLGNGSDFDSAIAASFQSLPGAGIRSADLTSLAAAWLAGTVPNHGVLLEEAPVLTTSFPSSEEPTVSRRPSLEVCYTTESTCAGTLDDGDACTTDTCDPVLGIVHTPISTDDSDPSTIDTCDPATGAVTHVACPALDPTVATRLIDAVGCIYQGPSAPQTGVTATFAAGTVAVVKGKVATRAGVPISGVQVSVLGHDVEDAESFGRVLTRADGAFELVVRGGQPLTISYEKAGYLPSQRQVATSWQRWSDAPDVVLIERDPVVTPVELGSATEIQVARGSVQTDESGTRQATLLFPPGTSGTMTVPDPNGPPGAMTTVALPAEVHVRATEYTVGPNGPEAMPGTLPAASAYTYAVELGLDEAVAAGATNVEFTQPVPFYVENFLSFPVGTPVPLGYYDAQQGIWIPSEDGRVIEILDVSGGVASLDVDGDDVADDASALDELGITAEELEQLGALYTAGTSLWRVQVTHFTPWDTNWPFGPPDDAVPPPDGSGAATDLPCNTCKATGSIIECESQVLGERLPVSGTPFSLHYQSDRTLGRRDLYRLPIPLTKATVHSKLLRIGVGVTIAGRSFGYAQSCPCAPNQEYVFEWDGKDALGRDVAGKQPVVVDIGYTYEGEYKKPNLSGTAGGGTVSGGGGSFGRLGGDRISGNRTRQDITLHRRWESTLGAWHNDADALGGLSLSEHHAYDPVTSILYRGDGERRTGRDLPNSLRRVAGEIPSSSVAAADGINAAVAYIGIPRGVAVGPDGSVYFPDTGTYRVRKIGPDGIISTVAGVYNQFGYNGDNRPATTALLGSLDFMTIGPEGSIYFKDGCRIRRVAPDGIIWNVAGNGSCSLANAPSNVAATSVPLGDSVYGISVAPDGALYIAMRTRVRMVTPDGIISTVAGTGDIGHSVDGVRATEAQFAWITAVAAAPDGGFYLAESGGAIGSAGNFIRRVDLNGVLTTVGGLAGESTGQTGNGGPATSAFLGSPQALALGPDGSIYFTTQRIADHDYPTLRRISPDGIITTIAGNRGTLPTLCSSEHCGLDGPATKAWFIRPRGLAVTPNGEIFIADGVQATNSLIVRLKAPFPGVAPGNITVPSEDGTEYYVFDERGRHLATKDALLGVTRYQFGYDPEGRLTTVTDVDGQVTTIQRDSSGVATAIVAPTLQTTSLAMDAEGYLWTLTNPANETTTLEYYPGTGLLMSMLEPLGRLHEFEYDEGRLIRDDDPADGFQTLSRTDTSSGYSVTLTTAEGRTRTHAIEKLAAGGEQRTHTGWNGLSTVVSMDPNGSITITKPDGTAVSTELTGDPRFGVQAPIIGKETYTTPLGRQMQITRARSVLPPNDLDITALTETTTVNGQVFTDVFDKASGTVVHTLPSGRHVTTTLNAQGRVAEIAVPGVLPLQATYHPNGRLHTLVQGSRTWTYTYEDNGWLTTVTQPLNHTTIVGHDPVGRVTQVTRPDNEIFGASYDAGGLVQSVTPPDRPAHTFGHTPTALLEQYLAPEVGGIARETSWSYDLDRLLTSSTRPGEPATVHTPDPTTGRPMLVTLPAGLGTIQYGYHPTTGHLASIAGPSGLSVAYGYDGALLTSRTWTTTGTGSSLGAVHWTYDNNFRIASERVNSGTALSFGYDADGFLNQAGGLTLHRHPQNGLYTGSSVGVVSDTVSPDDYGAVDTYVAQVAGSAVYEVSYTPDALGRIDQRTETIMGETHAYDYAYDLAGRLTDVVRDGVLTAHYDYDANGNRLARTSPAGAEGGTYDDQDRLLTYGTRTYVTSPAGDRTSVTDTATGATTTFTYDPGGNLRHVDLPDGAELDYLIDGEGHRVWKQRNGVNVQGFLYRSALQPVAELDGAGTVVARFVYAQGRNVPDLVLKGGAAYRILTDHLGSPRLVVDAASGEVAQRLDYDEWGNVTLDTNPGFQPFGFAGGLYDRETKLVRFGARDYDPSVGRWTSKDASGFTGGPNFYAYGHNDPVNYVDPDGRLGILATAGIGFVAGGVGSIIMQGLTKGFGCVDYGEAAIAATAGGLAGLGVGWLGTGVWGSALIGGFASEGQYLTTAAYYGQDTTGEGIAGAALLGAVGGGFAAWASPSPVATMQFVESSAISGAVNSGLARALNDAPQVFAATSLRSIGANVGAGIYSNGPSK